jgi:NTE family protein
VLSAGGSLGYAYHAGVLAALSQVVGWEPRSAELIVGTSAGSLAAAVLRAGLSARDLAARVLGDPLSPEGQSLAARLGPAARPPPRSQSPRRRGLASTELLRRALLRPGSVRFGALAAAILPAGEISNQPVVSGIRRFFGDRWPAEDTWICAVSLEDGGRVVFGSPGAPPASLADAVAASSAIPAFFEPVTIGGRRYVDGGVHSVTNLDVVAGLGLDLVIVSSPMSSTLDALRRTLDLPIRAASAARLAREAALVRRRGTDVVVFQPTPEDLGAMGLNLMDAARRRAVVRQAMASTRRRLQAGGLLKRLEVVRA